MSSCLHDSRLKSASKPRTSDGGCVILCLSEFCNQSTYILELPSCFLYLLDVCNCLSLSLSLYFDTVASRRSTHSANFPWAFLRNSSSLQHKKNKWYKWYKWYKKSLEVSFVHQHSFNRQVSVGPGCRKHGTWVALPNLPNLIEKNLAILGDQATFRLILRSLPTHDEIVRIYLWVIAVDLYVYCGFLWHLNELECWNSGRKLPRAVGSLMFSVSCHNHASMAGCPQCQVCQVFKHF